MSEISTADMLSNLDWVYRIEPFYCYEAIRAALLERDALKAEAEELNSDIEIQKKFVTKADEWFDEMLVWKARAEKAEAEVGQLRRNEEAFRVTICRIADERDALKAEVEDARKAVECWRVNEQTLADLGAEWKARAEKAEAERDEWRDKATKSVTREWLHQRAGLLSTMNFMGAHPEEALRFLLDTLKQCGVVVADEEGK